MFERLTDRARQVMALANQEAQRLNHEYIGTEHILLGLVKEGTGVGADVLKSAKIDLRQVRVEIEKQLESGADRVTIGKLPQTPRGKKVIEYAIEEARGFGHRHVGSEHLLLGLVREQDGIGSQVLRGLGLDIDAARAEVRRLVPPGADARNPDAGCLSDRRLEAVVAAWPSLPPPVRDAIHTIVRALER